MFAPVADLIAFTLATIPVKVDSGVEMLNAPAYGLTARSATGVVFTDPSRPTSIVTRAIIPSTPANRFRPKLQAATVERVELSAGEVSPVVRLVLTDLAIRNPAAPPNQTFTARDFRVRYRIGNTFVEADVEAGQSSILTSGVSTIVAKIPATTIVGSATISVIREDLRIVRDPLTGATRTVNGGLERLRRCRRLDR